MIFSTASKELTQDVLDYRRGLELALLQEHDDAADWIEMELLLGIEPDDCLIRANRNLEILRTFDTDLFPSLYGMMSEATRERFREAGRHDREDAEAVTAGVIEMLAAMNSHEQVTVQ